MEVVEDKNLKNENREKNLISEGNTSEGGEGISEGNHIGENITNPVTTSESIMNSSLGNQTISSGTVVTTTATENNPNNPLGTSESEADAANETVLELRDPLTRPIYRLSVKLIDTYKFINKVYYEAKARKIREQQGSSRVGVHNDGYDDQNYDYIIHGDEMFAERYILKHRIGKVTHPSPPHPMLLSLSHIS